MIKLCKATSYANQINTNIIEAKEYYNKLKIKEKVFNDVQQDLLHKIEGLGKFDLYTGWQLAKSLQKLRQARREAKNELKTMEMLVRQLGGFQVQEKKISNQDNHLTQLNYENGYHKRQLQMNGDILNEVDEILKVEYMRSPSHEHKDNIIEVNEDHIYGITDTLPKIKGITVKIKYKSLQQKQHLMNSVSKSYAEYELNEQEKFVKLINRKKGSV